MIPYQSDPCLASPNLTGGGIAGMPAPSGAFFNENSLTMTLTVQRGVVMTLKPPSNHSTRVHVDIQYCATGMYPPDAHESLDNWSRGSTSVTLLDWVFEDGRLEDIVLQGLPTNRTGITADLRCFRLYFDSPWLNLEGSFSAVQLQFVHEADRADRQNVRVPYQYYSEPTFGGVSFEYQPQHSGLGVFFSSDPGVYITLQDSTPPRITQSG